MTQFIRAAIVGDEEVLARLNRFVQDLHLVQRPEHFKPTQIRELAEWYDSLLQSSTARLWIAEVDGQPVGYLSAILHHHQENPFARARDWWEIDQIAVDPTYRRKGIARSLIVEAMNEARAQGIHQVEAVTWSFNGDIQEVLRRLGFVSKTIRFERKASALPC
jgi:ribosomal protein S18 acetylase RimI-like enzyme